MIMFRKLALVCVLVLSSIISVAEAMESDEKSIVVTVQGIGANRTEALEDALRNAVRKVVGIYVVTESKVKEEDLSDDIYINADAVVTEHSEVKKTEIDGIVTLTIEARVVKNDLLKYVAKTESTHITGTDTGNLLNKRRALATAEKSLDYIFKDYSKLYLAKKTGDFELGADDDVENDTVSIILPYELRFNLNEYMKFRSRMVGLLEKVCVAKVSGRTDDYDKITGYDSHFWKFATRDAQAAWPQGTRAIVFIDEKTENNTKSYDYCFYAVPNQIYQKINSLTDSFSVVIFQFDVKGGQPLKKYMKADSRFWYKDSGNGVYFVCFQNYMRADIENYDSKWLSQREYKKTWHFTEDQVQAMKSCTIKVLSGRPARYVWFLNNDEEYQMKRLACDGYVPAMLALAENWRGNEEWYHTAALHGDRTAQRKIGWQNSGLGFEIGWTNNGAPVVYNVQKGIPVRKGMVIESINGQMVSERNARVELSKLIGAIPSGSSVEIKFTNGKTLNLKAQK